MRLPRPSAGFLLLIGLAAAAAPGCSGGSSPSGPTGRIDIGANRPDIGVAFGDSISHGRRRAWSIDDAGPDEPGYRVDLEQLFAADGRAVHIIEDGDPGTLSADGVVRIGEALALRPAFLVLLYGTNDAYGQVSSGVLISHLRFIAEECRKNQTIVVLCSLPPVCGSGRIAQLAKIREYNPLIGSLAAELDARWGGVVYADLFSAFESASDGNFCSLLNPVSGNHPTPEGYALIASTIYGQLGGLAW